MQLFLSYSLHNILQFYRRSWQIAWVVMTLSSSIICYFYLIDATCSQPLMGLLSSHSLLPCLRIIGGVYTFRSSVCWGFYLSFDVAQIRGRGRQTSIYPLSLPWLFIACCAIHYKVFVDVMLLDLWRSLQILCMYIVFLTFCPISLLSLSLTSVVFNIFKIAHLFIAVQSHFKKLWCQNIMKFSKLIIGGWNKCRGWKKFKN